MLIGAFPTTRNLCYTYIINVCVPSVCVMYNDREVYLYEV